MDGERVVVGDLVVLDDAQVPEGRVGPSSLNGPGTGPRRIDEEAAIQVLRPRPDVLKVDGGIQEEFLLDVKAPLVLLGRGQIPVGRNDVRRRARADHAERPREGQRGVRRIRVEGELGSKRRIVRQERERVHLVRVVVDPPPRPQDRLLGQPVSGAQARRPQVIVRLVKLEPDRRVACGNETREVRVQHRCEAFVRLRRRMQLVTQTKAQCQVARGLPRVVDEEAVAPMADVALELVHRRPHRDRQPDEEVGHGVAGHLAVE